MRNMNDHNTSLFTKLARNIVIALTLIVLMGGYLASPLVPHAHGGEKNPVENTSIEMAIER